LNLEFYVDEVVSRTNLKFKRVLGAMLKIRWLRYYLIIYDSLQMGLAFFIFTSE